MKTQTKQEKKRTIGRTIRRVFETQGFAIMAGVGLISGVMAVGDVCVKNSYALKDISREVKKVHDDLRYNLLSDYGPEHGRADLDSACIQLSNQVTNNPNLLRRLLYNRNAVDELQNEIREEYAFAQGYGRGLRMANAGD